MRVGRPRGGRPRGARAGVHPGYALGRDYPGMDDVLLVARHREADAGRDRPARGGAEAQREADLREVAAGPPRVGDRRSPTACPRRGARRSSPRRAAAPARARRARADAPLHRALDAQLRDRHGLLPARLLHDEVQPAVNERLAALPGFRDLHPHQEEDGAQGALELMCELQEILAEITGLDAVSLQPAAGSQGELTGPDADARLLRRPRRGRAAPQDRHPRHRARHEPRERDDGRLRAHAGQDRRARQHRPRRPARQGRRAHRRADAHEPVDARALRRAHRGDRARSSTAPARSCTTTAPT